MFANKLKIGDEIRVIASSTSMAVVKGEQVEIAAARLHNLGFKVTFGRHVNTHDEFFSSSISERIEDLHEAFRNPSVKGILTALGGYNSNQLLRYIDYDLIRKNPKIFCGYSDITALGLAIYKKSGLVTYSGPFFSTFGIKYGFDYTLQSFLSAVTNDGTYEIEPSKTWSDDPWYRDQQDVTFYHQDGYFVLNEGKSEGKIIGGHLSTLNLLQGTEYMPSLKNAILFIEDDEETHPLSFDRNLQSLLYLRDAQLIKGLLIGRFQKGSNMTDEALQRIVKSKAELAHIPVIANVNIGHVNPFATFPIGAKAIIEAKGTETKIMIEQAE
ncbi:LD-carboxypeptidase [Bacillus aquiflavi]|uniref:LD-carboxypeptidase n=1 Tax=Bacillus aquiflavi TaxID=2672567 RepID=A0A6B3VYP8_9BACI|nr:S66 peptidase family protein [Bacillus aquiflavi]MBA4537766.1 LD-carboxypeptidase [Bacillus aquiflavi]NEY82022.1 LD-carboxypeptidase [Bacillus aquiflavi]